MVGRQSALLSESPLRRQRTESCDSSSASTVTTTTERTPETGAPVQYGPQDGLTGLRNIGNTVSACWGLGHGDVVPGLGIVLPDLALLMDPLLLYLGCNYAPVLVSNRCCKCQTLPSK